MQYEQKRQSACRDNSRLEFLSKEKQAENERESFID